MKKKYNPFKMWGSWIGAGVGIISSFFISNSPGETFKIILSLFSWFSIVIFRFILRVNPNQINVMFSNIIIWFILGWLITVLWRKYK